MIFVYFALIKSSQQAIFKHKIDPRRLLTSAYY